MVSRKHQVVIYGNLKYKILIMKKLIKYKTVEQFIHDKAEHEELERLRNFKRNVLANIVFDIDDKLLEILETFETKNL